jgi:hypothetical protein
LFEIRALTVLHVVNVPGTCGGVLDPIHQADKALGRIDVARLRGNDENRVDPCHRQHPHKTPERALTLSLQHPLDLACDLGRVAVAGWEEGVGLPGQDVDVEGADQTDQGLPYRGVATHDQCVAPRIGADLAALGYKGLEHLGQVPGCSVAQRHDLGAPAQRVPGDLVARCADGDRHDSVDAVPFDQGRAIFVEQRLKGG